MNNMLKFAFAASVLAAFSLDTMSAADTSATPDNTTAQPADANKATQGSPANTTLQQRVEIRKKTKAHWRDPPTGDRASRRREYPEKNPPPDKQAAKSARQAGKNRISTPR